VSTTGGLGWLVPPRPSDLTGLVARRVWLCPPWRCAFLLGEPRYFRIRDSDFRSLGVYVLCFLAASLDVGSVWFRVCRFLRAGCPGVLFGRGRFLPAEVLPDCCRVGWAGCCRAAAAGAAKSAAGCCDGSPELVLFPLLLFLVVVVVVWARSPTPAGSGAGGASARLGWVVTAPPNSGLPCCSRPAAGDAAGTEGGACPGSAGGGFFCFPDAVLAGLGASAGGQARGAGAGSGWLLSTRRLASLLLLSTCSVCTPATRGGGGKRSNGGEWSWTRRGWGSSAGGGASPLPRLPSLASWEGLGFGVFFLGASTSTTATAGCVVGTGGSRGFSAGRGKPRPGGGDPTRATATPAARWEGRAGAGAAATGGGAVVTTCDLGVRRLVAGGLGTTTMADGVSAGEVGAALLGCWGFFFLLLGGLGFGLLAAFELVDTVAVRGDLLFGLFPEGSDPLFFIPVASGFGRETATDGGFVGSADFFTFLRFSFFVFNCSALFIIAVTRMAGGQTGIARSGGASIARSGGASGGDVEEGTTWAATGSSGMPTKETGGSGSTSGGGGEASVAEGTLMTGAGVGEDIGLNAMESSSVVGTSLKKSIFSKWRLDSSSGGGCGGVAGSVTAFDARALASFFRFLFFLVLPVFGAVTTELVRGGGPPPTAWSWEGGAGSGAGRATASATANGAGRGGGGGGGGESECAKPGVAISGRASGAGSGFGISSFSGGEWCTSSYITGGGEGSGQNGTGEYTKFALRVGEGGTSIPGTKDRGPLGLGKGVPAVDSTAVGAGVCCVACGHGSTATDEGSLIEIDAGISSLSWLTTLFIE